ncbi:hypothetical protein OAO01_07060 [Oligoflexia bacterium]|nr:hypothetical protein [Oligoflexia bacterium]
MELYDIFQLVLNAAECGEGYVVQPPIGSVAQPPVLTVFPGICPAAAFTAVGAAFETIGYWVQADLIDYLTMTSFGLWAPMLYILAAFGGMIGMAMGAPPKTYLWFFIGPAIYAWLLDTRILVDGVEWVVGTEPQDQRIVWKLSEVGIINTNLHFRATGDGAKPVLTRSDAKPTESVAVAMPFLWFDELISHTVQWLVRWTGINRMQSSRMASNKQQTNIIGDVVGNQSSFQDKKWYLLSNTKWTYFDSITSVKLASPELRDAFVTFTASECGDDLRRALDDAKYIAATHTRGRTTPNTVFKKHGSLAAGAAGPATAPYFQVFSRLHNFIPFPDSLRNILKESDAASVPLPQPNPAPASTVWSRSSKFADSISWKNGPNNYYGHVNTPTAGGLIHKEVIRCDAYFDLMLYAFRWEAAHQYFQIMAERPSNMSDIDLIYILLYGWAVKDSKGHPLGTAPDNKLGITVDQEMQLRNFMYNLILVYLFRNEIAIAKQPMDLRYASATQIQNVTEGWQRSLGSKTKYGELFTWALMVPYIQGVLLYLLAVAYPFACVAMVVPGWHTVLLTWATFFAWVKLWDLGFAMVVSIERSLWAMLGNSTNAKGLLSRVVDMQFTGQSFGVTCSSSGTGDAWKWGCDVPNVWLTDGGIANAATAGQAAFVDNIQLFDFGMTLGPNLDLDLANGYYIYILTALYFAVPAVTGQLVLGAKAGASGMVSNAIGGVATESGRAAGSAFQGDIVQRIKSNQETVGQAAYAKEMGSNGIYSQHMSARTQAFDHGLKGADSSARAQGAGAKKEMVSHNQAMEGTALQTGRAAWSATSDAAFGNPAKGRKGAIPALKEDADRRKGNTPEAVEAAKTAGTKKTAGGTKQALTAGGADAKTPGAKKPGGDHLQRGNIADRHAASAGQYTDQLAAGAGGVGEDEGGRVLNATSSLPKDLMNSSAGLFQDLHHAAGNDSIARRGYQAQAEYAGEAAGHNVDSFEAQQTSGRHERHAGMLGSHANFKAASAAWRAKNNYGNRMGATATALGLFAGGLDAGPKPIDADGMAMSGMLGKGNQDLANHWKDKGKASRDIGSRGKNLRASSGRDAVKGTYKPISNRDALINSLEAVPGFLKNNVTATRSSLSQ